MEEKKKLSVAGNTHSLEEDGLKIESAGEVDVENERYVKSGPPADVSFTEDGKVKDNNEKDVER